MGPHVQRWLWRHPITVSIGSLWFLALVTVVVIDAFLSDAPPDNGCMMGLDCVQNPESEFMWTVTLAAGPAALGLGGLGAALGLVLEKPFLRRAERLGEAEPPGR